MRKLLVLIALVVLLGLSGCQKQPNVIVVEVEKDFNDYDYMVGEVLTRNISIQTKGFKYTLKLENGEIGEVYSEELFSIGENVLVIEYEDNKSILIDLS